MSQNLIVDRETRFKDSNNAHAPTRKSQANSGSSLKERLDSQKNVDTLSLVDLFIGDEGAYELARFLRQNNNFTNLQLRGNNISAAGFEVICQALKNSNRVRILSSEWNNIGSDISGVVALHQLLQDNNTIETVDLKNNRLSSNFGRVIADILRDSNSLRKIDLRWNELGEEGGRQILNALQDSQKRLAIDVNGNKIPENVFNQINNFGTGSVAGSRNNLNERDLNEKVFSSLQPNSNKSSIIVSKSHVPTNNPLSGNEQSAINPYSAQNALFSSKYTNEVREQDRVVTSAHQNYPLSLPKSQENVYVGSSKPNLSTNAQALYDSVVGRNINATSNNIKSVGLNNTETRVGSSLRPSSVIPGRIETTIYNPGRSSPPRGQRDDQTEGLSPQTRKNLREHVRTVENSINPKDNLVSTQKYQPKHNGQNVERPKSSFEDSPELKSVNNLAKEMNVRFESDENNLKVGKLISDLEKMLDRERVRAGEAQAKLNVVSRDLDVESRLRQDMEIRQSEVLEELKRKDLEFMDLRSAFEKVAQENNGLKNEVAVLRQENQRLGDYSNKKVIEIESSYKLQIENLQNQNRSLQDQYNNIHRDLNTQIIELKREFDTKVRDYEDQINEFSKINDELSNELANQIHYIERSKVEHEENIKRSVGQARDEEIRKAEIAIRELDSELRNITDANVQLTRRNDEMLRDLQTYEKQIRDQHLQFANELNRLGSEIDRLRSELNQANGVVQRQNSELSAKDGIISRLEVDIGRLRGELQRLNETHVANIESLKREFEAERRRFEDHERQLIIKIEELERRLVDSQNETITITREYDRLVQMIQGNVNKVIHDTFVTHKNTSEIRQIEHRVTSTPSRGLAEERPGASSRILASEKRYF